MYHESIQLVSQFRLMSIMHVSLYHVPALPLAAMIPKQARGQFSSHTRSQHLCLGTGHHTHAQFVYPHPQERHALAVVTSPTWGFPEALPLLWGRQALSPPQGSLLYSLECSLLCWIRVPDSPAIWPEPPVTLHLEPLGWSF